MEHNHFSIKTFMAIMAERDAAIRERNMALEERKRAFAERDMAMLQREAALVERNTALQERDEAIAVLQFRGSLFDENNMTSDFPGNGTVRGAKRDHNGQQTHHMFGPAEAKYSHREIPTSDAFQITGIPSESAKPRKVNQTKETKTSKSPRVGKKGAEGLCKQISTATSNCLKNDHDLGDDCENLEMQVVARKDNLGLNQVNFDESSMPVPVCSCTGMPQPCYKWGNGGWQSACCTTATSVYPLPQASSKRISGRKMSGNVFAKLLNRLADEGHDLSTPLDLKEHWAKHGTKRYSTPK